MPSGDMGILQAMLRFAVSCALAGMITLYAGIPVPRRIINYRAFPFRAYGFEREGRIYTAVGVHRWKDSLPDASKSVKAMMRKKVNMKMDAQALERLIRETCVAEFVHWLLIALTPLYSCTIPLAYGVLFSLIYALCNLPFIIVQRYNRPRLIRAMQLMENRERRKQP